MSLDFAMSPRRPLALDAEHLRSVRGLLTAGRVGATLAGSAWTLLALSSLGWGSWAGLEVVLVPVGMLVCLGGVITEIVGWFGLRGLEGHRGWATSVAVLFLVECTWAFVFPILLVVSGPNPIGLIPLTMALVGPRCVVLAVGFWARRGIAVRVAASAYSLAALCWVAFAVASLENSLSLSGVGVVAFLVGTLCEAVGHFATGAYFIENRHVAVDIRAFT